MGTPDFAVPSLERVIAAGYPVVGVVTGPDKPRGRGQQVSGTPVKEAAAKHAIPVFQPESLQDATFVTSLRALNPDLLVVVAFRILPPSVFTIPRCGSFNLHASLLPRYRGAAPINWAIINGETETGVSTFFLEDRVDTGKIIFQKSTPITPDDDAGTLHDKLARIGADAVLETVRAIEAGTASPVSQDARLASKAPKIFRDDCHINWSLDAEHVRNFIRGLSPLPAAWTTHSSTLLKIFKTIHYDHHTGIPGALAVEGDALIVSCGTGRLRILELQQEGRKRMSAGEFLRGFRVGAGVRLA